MRSCAWIGPSIIIPEVGGPTISNRHGTFSRLAWNLWFRRRDGLDLIAGRLDLEQVPLLLPRVRRHPPGERVRVVDLGRHHLAGIGHVTRGVQVPQTNLVHDESSVMAEQDTDRLPAAFFTDQD